MAPAVLTWTLRAALGLVTWGALEAMAFAGLFALARWRAIRYEPLRTTSLTAVHRQALERLLAGDATYVTYSQTLGWSIRPGGVAAPYRANAQGLRADREYAPTPGRDTTRIAAFGDSFTHGDDVAYGETFEALLEASLPNSEVLNFGVGGFGLDQALLRWREEGQSFHPRIVLIDYLTENILRHVNTYRPFHVATTRQPLAKPRFVMRTGRLELAANPATRLEDYRALLDDPATVLRRFGAGDYFYQHTPHASAWDRSAIVRLVRLVRFQLLDLPSRPVLDGAYNTSSDAYAVTLALFDEFVASVRGDSAVPLIVVFPTKGDFRRRTIGMPKAYAPLLEEFARRGYDFVDVLDAFPDCRRHCDLNAIIPGHFAPAAHRVIAEFLAQALRHRGLVGQGAGAARQGNAANPARPGAGTATASRGSSR